MCTLDVCPWHEQRLWGASVSMEYASESHDTNSLILNQTTAFHVECVKTIWTNHSTGKTIKWYMNHFLKNVKIRRRWMFNRECCSIWTLGSFKISHWRKAFRYNLHYTKYKSYLITKIYVICMIHFSGIGMKDMRILGLSPFSFKSEYIFHDCLCCPQTLKA